MNIVSLLIGLIVGAALALTAYILIRKSILRGKRDEILEKAEIEAEKIKNDKILQAKEKFLSLKAEHEEYVSGKNAQIRDIESRVKQKENTRNPHPVRQPPHRHADRRHRSPQRQYLPRRVLAPRSRAAQPRYREVRHLGPLLGL